jgi:type IV pilus assembly protein PilB
VTRLSDTGAPEAGSAYWQQSTPDGVLDYLLALGARKRASDISLAPEPDQIAVRYRIDGFSFRVDPIPRSYEDSLERALFAMFSLDPARRARPQSARATARLGEDDYDLLVQTVPGVQGLSATIKLVNRATFIKDFATLGLEIEDRVHLMEQLRSPGGLILVTSPAFNGSGTTGYSIMNYLAHAQRDTVSLEAPVHWHMDGVRQVDVETDARGLRMEETLRSVVAVRPDVVMLSSIPDRGTATLVAQLATSVLVVGLLPAQTAAQGITALLALGVPPPLVANCLSTVTCQRLIRRICTICRQPAEPPAPQTLALHGIAAEEAATLKFFKGKGCPTCNKIGYRGRQAVFEVIAATDELRGGIVSGLGTQELETLAVGAGLRPIRDRCLDLVREGVTTFDEFARLRL